MKKMIGATVLTMLILLVFPQVADAGLVTGVEPYGPSFYCWTCMEHHRCPSHCPELDELEYDSSYWQILLEPE